MCLPVAAAPLATIATIGSMGSSVAGFMAQDQAARSAQRFQASRYAAVTEAAGRAYEFDIAQLQKRGIQEVAVASQQTLAARREGFRAEGSTRARAGSANVGGAVVDDVAREFRALAAENELNIQTNLSNTLDQLDAQALGSQAQAKNRINSALPQPIQRPSLLSLGFGLLGNLADGTVLHGQVTP